METKGIVDLVAQHHIEYPCTNESIQAVLVGLTPCKNDVVISIAGSGDIPFAIAPYVKKVFAVDRDPEQIWFIKRQIELLQNRDPELFDPHKLLDSLYGIADVSPGDLNRRRDYFFDKLPTIKTSLSKIELIKGDIIQVLDEISQRGVRFNKVYLSNVFEGHHGLSRSYLACQNCSAGLSLGGLVYEAYQNEKCDNLSLHPDFEIDSKRTQQARRMERKFNPSGKWTPTVYKKIR